jgi:hypothetical protein
MRSRRLTTELNYLLSQFSVVMCSTRNATGHITTVEGVGPEVLNALSHRFNFT